VRSAPRRDAAHGPLGWPRCRPPFDARIAFMTTVQISYAKSRRTPARGASAHTRRRPPACSRRRPRLPRRAGTAQISPRQPVRSVRCQASSAQEAQPRRPSRTLMRLPQRPRPGGGFSAGRRFPGTRGRVPPPGHSPPARRFTGRLRMQPRAKGLRDFREVKLPRPLRDPPPGGRAGRRSGFVKPEERRRTERNDHTAAPPPALFDRNRWLQSLYSPEPPGGPQGSNSRRHSPPRRIILA